MNYEWDENKLAINLANHKVHFGVAEQFEWESASVEPDNRKDYGEPRFIAYGFIGVRLYCLVFTRRNDAVRIISLRKANPREVKRYVIEN
ncbi:BrnT family toxin [Crenothrix polyspora]|nr:BrnT family toxin [Crenothrix polyspora]